MIDPGGKVADAVEGHIGGDGRAAAPLLVVDDVSLRFGGVTALAGVSFDVHHGELFAIIGPNGAGKTSIFNCLNAVYRPQQGSITLDGTELVGQKPGFTAKSSEMAAEISTTAAIAQRVGLHRSATICQPRPTSTHSGGRMTR